MEKKALGEPLVTKDGTVIPLSLAYQVGDLIYLSGQLAMADNAIVGNDIETQTRQCLENIKALLAGTGCRLSDVFKATIWLVNTADFPGFNRVYAEYFPENPPARSTVRSDLMIPGALVEIEVVALKPEQG